MVITRLAPVAVQARSPTPTTPVPLICERFD
jgi:hypothetical protein